MGKLSSNTILHGYCKINRISIKTYRIPKRYQTPLEVSSKSKTLWVTLISLQNQMGIQGIRKLTKFAYNLTENWPKSPELHWTAQ